MDVALYHRWALSSHHTLSFEFVLYARSTLCAIKRLFFPKDFHSNHHFQTVNHNGPLLAYVAIKCSKSPHSGRLARYGLFVMKVPLNRNQPTILADLQKRIVDQLTE